MMTRIQLSEHQPSGPHQLDQEQVRALRAVAPSVVIAPAPEVPGGYYLTPSSEVGGISIPGYQVEIHPKFAIRNLFFMLAYNIDPKRWRNMGFDFDSDELLTGAVIPGFVRQVRTAIKKGLLHGYQEVEEAASVVRGHIRFNEQISRRFGRLPPIEIRYDDFTLDVLHNRLLKAAIRRLRRTNVRSGRSVVDLVRLEPAFSEVTEVLWDPHSIPEVAFTRLAEHYRSAVALARLILANTAIELREGQVHSSSFLIDMNKVFEDFVVVALREALGKTEREVPQGAKGKGLRLDKSRWIKLEPDLSMWDGPSCVMVGDAKYKRTTARGVTHPDIYQLLAYAIAADLPGGLLVYAKGEAEETIHETVQLNRQLIVRTLDLSQNPEEILGQVASVAETANQLAQSRTMAPAPI